MSSRTHGVSASKGPPVVALRQGRLLQETLVIKRIRRLTKDAPVKVQLAERYHEPVAFAQDFASDDGVFGDEAYGGCVGGHADGFIPHGVELGALIVQMLEIDSAVFIKGGFCFVADHFDERGGVEDVREKPKGSFAGTRIDTIMFVSLYKQELDETTRELDRKMVG